MFICKQAPFDLATMLRRYGCEPYDTTISTPYISGLHSSVAKAHDSYPPHYEFESCHRDAVLRFSFAKRYNSFSFLENANPHQCIDLEATHDIP